jgi:hypothetical protein
MDLAVTGQLQQVGGCVPVHRAVERDEDAATPLSTNWRPLSAVGCASSSAAPTSINAFLCQTGLTLDTKPP